MYIGTVVRDRAFHPLLLLCLNASAVAVHECGRICWPEVPSFVLSEAVFSSVAPVFRRCDASPRMKEMQRQKDDFRYLLTPMVNDYESLDCSSRAGYVIYQVAGCMALLRRSRVCGHWLELPLKGPKAEAAKVWKELSVRSQYKFCSRLFPLLYTAPHQERESTSQSRRRRSCLRGRNGQNPVTCCRCLGS